MASKLYILYLHKNIINNKVYIGITSQSPSQRWGSNGSGYKKGQDKFYNTIKKYGWDNFEHIILKTHLSKQEAEELEVEYIKKYDSIINGYNSRTGGNINSNFSVETKKKMSESHKGKHPTLTARLKNSISNKGKHNFKHTNEAKKKMSDKKKKKVKCLNNGQIFNSLEEACNWCGLKSQSCISRVCNKERKTSGRHPITNEKLIWEWVE